MKILTKNSSIIGCECTESSAYISVVVHDVSNNSQLKLLLLSPRLIILNIFKAH